MELLEKIKSLYSKLPSVGCYGCGHCCVSPTTTLSEFIYLFDYLNNNFTENEILDFILSPAEIHPEYEGNSHCIFLKNHKCSVHSGRPGACRLFGIPSLSEMKIDNMEQCRNKITTTKGRGDLEYIESWLNSLFEFESTLCSYAESPYFIKGFNIHSWLDLFFDGKINNSPFIEIKKFISENSTLDKFRLKYKLQTKLFDKINQITKLNKLIGNAGATELKPLLLDIRDNYPLTGTYFFEEANAYLNAIENQ